MKVKVQQAGGTEEFSMTDGASVQDLLSIMGLFPDAYIIMRGKVPVPLDSALTDGDIIRLVKVASGG